MKQSTTFTAKDTKMIEMLITAGVIVAFLFTVSLVTFVAGLVGDMLAEIENDKYY
jgi:hypothetical protein